jgi:hypothetical protein
MVNTTAKPLSCQSAAPAWSIKPLVSIVMLVATILFALFDSTALIIVWQGSVEYQGANFTTQHGKTIVYDVTDPRLYKRGMRPGQTVRWTGRSEWRAAFPHPGDTVQVDTLSGPVTVRATHVPLAQPLNVIAAITILAAIAVLIFAGVLCYRKPGIMTASLWFFVAVNFNVDWVINVYGQAPDPIARAVVLFTLAVLGGWGYYPLLWFALRFPDDRIEQRAMRIADRAWTCISLVALAWFLIDLSRATFPGGNPGAPYENMLLRYTIPQNIPFAAGMAAFLWVYARSGSPTRQRLLWAIVGFLLMIILETIGNFATEIAPGLYVAGNVALMLATFCPLALAYAVFRHHLLDISFVVNRALVYSLLTATIVLVVGFVDWLAGRFLLETRAALAVEAVAIIGFGVVLQRVHGALERMIDRVIFASRHAAERQIKRVIAGLAFANSHTAVLQSLVDEPRSALDLVSCAVFIGDGDLLALQSAYGWEHGEHAAMERDDPLARLLLSERRSIDVAEVHWHAGVAGSSTAAIDVAIPLFSRNDLLGIVLYGRHSNGSAIDPEERKLLQRLCDAAAVAYEAVQLARAREEITALRARFTAFGA